MTSRKSERMRWAFGVSDMAVGPGALVMKLNDSWRNIDSIDSDFL
jgi:hypothetical protein